MKLAQAVCCHQPTRQGPGNPILISTLQRPRSCQIPDKPQHKAVFGQVHQKPHRLSKTTQSFVVLDNQLQPPHSHLPSPPILFLPNKTPVLLRTAWVLFRSSRGLDDKHLPFVRLPLYCALFCRLPVGPHKGNCSQLTASGLSPNSKKSNWTFRPFGSSRLCHSFPSWQQLPALILNPVNNLFARFTGMPKTGFPFVLPLIVNKSLLYHVKGKAFKIVLLIT